MMWREYRKGEKDVNTDVSFFPPLKITVWSWVVRLEAVFYGPVGGAHCLLKWCFNSPSVTTTLTHTIYRACGRGREGEGVQEEEEEKGGKRQTLMYAFVRFCMHVAVGRNQLLLLHVRTGLKCLLRPLQSEAHSLSPQLAIASHIILKLLKWCWNEAASWSYINFKAHSGFSTVELGPACLCWYITSLLLSVDLEKRQLGV